MRADEMLAAGDIDGQRVWIRIGKAIDKLLSGLSTRNPSEQAKRTIF